MTGTAYYSSGSETFPVSNLTDGRLNDTGTPGNWSFWLTPSGQNGTATIDLGSDYTLDSFFLQNTLNRGYQDREAATVGVYVGDTAPTFGDTSTYGTLVQNVQFPDTEGTGVIADDSFAIAPTTGRYVTVDLTAFYGSSGGLNEVEAFGTPAAVSAAPEPDAWALMLGGVSAMGLMLRRRRRVGVTFAA